MPYQQNRSRYGSQRSNAGRSRSSSFNNRSQSRRPRKEDIHPSRFIKAAKAVETESYQPTHSFGDFDLNPQVAANIEKKGMTIPTPIQDQAIPAGLKGQDVIGIANTGTGKTLAFAVPVLESILKNRSSKAIVLAPTRELAQQIEDEFRSIARGSGILGALLIGGAAMGRQLSDLRQNPSVIIGTPGRIKDHLERGSLKLDHFNIAVLDEVDRMLDMGFVDDMRLILGKLSPTRQSFFFSATLDHKVTSLIQAFSHQPVTISVKTGITAENVEQDIVNYKSKEDKLEKLHDLLIGRETSKTLVFDDTQRSVERLSNTLRERGFQADAIHGGKSQGQRQRALSKFKNNEIDVLVATDVAARGLDVDDITHVINYSTPNSYDDYVHRIGRAGRAGKAGKALTFIENLY